MNKGMRFLTRDSCQKGKRKVEREQEDEDEESAGVDKLPAAADPPPDFCFCFFTMPNALLFSYDFHPLNDFILCAMQHARECGASCIFGGGGGR